MLLLHAPAVVLVVIMMCRKHVHIIVSYLSILVIFKGGLTKLECEFAEGFGLAVGIL